MNIFDFNSLLPWLIAHGYVVMFLLMCIEGPLATTAAAFAASLGYFNPFFVILLSILGDLVPDTIYYYIGHFSRTSVIDKYGKYVGLSEHRMKRIEELLDKHFYKTMISFKFTPFVSVIGFMLVGSTKKSYTKFIIACTLITLAKTTLFVLVGYAIGKFFALRAYIGYGDYFLFGVFIIMALVFFGYKKLSSWLGNKVEKL
jgi:membrane protein DedA with SNARE-associated domain